MKPKSLCVDEAVITDHHVEQRNTGLLTGDPVCLSRHDLAAMLALVSHHKYPFSAKQVPPRSNAAGRLKKSAISSNTRLFVTRSEFRLPTADGFNPHYSCNMCASYGQSRASTILGIRQTTTYKRCRRTNL